MRDLSLKMRVIWIFILSLAFSGCPVDATVHNNVPKKCGNLPVPAPVPMARGFVPTALGLLGYRSAGTSSSRGSCFLPILAFHLSPRSSDEYTEALPLLAADGRIVIAVDAPGFGFSEPQPQIQSLDELGDMAIEIADYFGLEEFAIVGSGIGTYIGLYAAALYPERVKSLVLSNTYKYTDALVELANQGVPLDFDFFRDFEFDAEGSHFLQLWNLRKNFVEPVLNTRLTQDHMTYQLNGQVSRAAGVTQLIPEFGPFVDWDFLSQNVDIPVLFVFGKVALAIFDAVGLEATGQVQETVDLFSDSQSTMVEGGSLWQFNELPETMATLVLDHVSASESNGKCNI